jgi:Mce-associated membrane protein
VVVALVLLLLTVAAVATATVLALRVRQDARIADARDEAPAAAERAAKAMLSYDYRHLPADRKRAAAYLTDGFEKKYLTNFALLEKQKDGTPGAAVQTKSVVTASVLGSGVVDAEDTVVRVLVYVNQVSKKPGVDPQIFQNRVSMTMEKDGNRWLVGDLKSY